MKKIICKVNSIKIYYNNWNCLNLYVKTFSYIQEKNQLKYIELGKKNYVILPLHNVLIELIQRKYYNWKRVYNLLQNSDENRRNNQ